MTNEPDPSDDHGHDRRGDGHGNDDRGDLAKAIDKATEIFTACLMMVLPGIGGHYVDKYLNTAVTFTLIGVLFGLVAGFVQIFKIVNKPDKTKNSNST